MAQRGRPRKPDPTPTTSPDRRNEYYCVRCGALYKVQRGNFYYNPSPLYGANNHFCDICRNCVEEMFMDYTNRLGTESAALRRICSKLDWYYSPALFSLTDKAGVTMTRVAAYASKLSLRAQKGKTFDTTIEEEHDNTAGQQTKEIVPVEVRNFFGDGIPDEDLLYLKREYDDWTSRYECQTKTQEQLFKNLAFTELNVMKAQRAGDSKAANEAMKAQQELMRTQNIAPLQRNDNTFADQNTFGTLIRKWEDTRPIPKPNPEWEDVDGIVRYITIYFIGHLCKMMHLRNRYSRLYEQEMAKYRVEYHEDEEEDDSETTFDKVYGDMLDAD